MGVQIKEMIKFYESAVEHVSVGIHAIDRNGQTILYNNKMKEIEGFNIEDISDRSILELFAFRQNDSTLLRVLQTGKKELNVKQTYWNKDGHEITTINDTYPLYDQGEIIGAIEFARDITSLEKLVYQPLRRYGEPLTFDIITAVSDQMKSVIESAKKASQAKLPVLLVGESGTGKDMIAESIHHELKPANNEFVPLFSRRKNHSILEKLEEYLGNDKAYTFFFERIEFLSIPMQQMLLKKLNEIHHESHMVIGSIGDDPVELIGNGQLLKELYYHFASLTIYIPPLAERKEDIKPFVNDYFSRHRERFASHIEGVAEDVMDLFHQYDWPGNLKELELLLDEISSMITNEKVVTYEMLPLHFRFKVLQLAEATREPHFFIVQSNKELLPLDEYLREAENYYVQNVLHMYEGNITKTAQALGMSRQNLQYRLRKLKK
ncbi:PAS domain S-box protein [Lysinibacillus yapensis]|uniref:PAS domain S-box protein n=1 Tax=Ureibacillus yapensis TaxID=2304605 RepID=A0A396SMK1_9BACL|nr:PAS domain S-box protein [Lysinibacillus yapensis]RHW36836.1 PAS domain S-box protein [Lysinibacillus yapensis]